MADKIQVRRGTASEWSASNPILSAGEIGLATDINKHKIGDGTSAWNSLSYTIPPYTEVVSLPLSSYLVGGLEAYLQVYGTTVGSYTALRIKKTSTSSWISMVNMVDFIIDNFISGGSGTNAAYGAPDDPSTTNYSTISIGGKTTVIKISYEPYIENNNIITINASYVSGDTLIGSQDPDTGELIYQTGELSFSVEKKFKEYYITNDINKNSWKKANEVPSKFETKTFTSLQWLSPHYISYDSVEKTFIIEFVDTTKTFDSWIVTDINNLIPNWSDVTIVSKTNLFKARGKKNGSAYLNSPDNTKLYIPVDSFYGDSVLGNNFDLKYKVDYGSGDQRVLAMTWAGPSWVVNPAGPASATARGTVYGKTGDYGSVSLGNQAWASVKGSDIVAIGDYALNKADWGSSNSTAVGTRSLENLTDGNGNIAIGFYAANSLEGGGNNIVIGYNSQLPETTISNQILIGNANSNRLRIPGLGIDWTPETVPGGPIPATLTTAGVLFGFYANTRTNVALGKNNLNLNTEELTGGSDPTYTGGSNVAIGHNNLSANTDGGGNTSVGTSNLQNSPQNHDSIAVGRFCLNSQYSSLGAVAVGWKALESGSGEGNTAIGYKAGNTVSSGNNLTLLGREAEPSTSTSSNQIVLGNSNVTALRCQVTSITALSDARDKKNIESLDLGLDFINKLNPVKFDWNMRDGGKVDVPDTGFIAQELVEIEDESGIAEYLKLTFRENPDKLEASYGRLIPVLVKAIQDLSKEVDKLKGN